MYVVRWYWGMTPQQKALCWIASCLSIVVYGIGIPCVLLLAYAHLGRANLDKK